MRILLLADIHSNWTALSAIEEEFDECLVVGDIVDYGTNPIPCVEWVQRHATYAVRGNHDHAVAQRVVGRGNSGFRRLAAVIRPYHWSVLEPQHMKYLSRLPVTQYATIGEHRFLLVHATPHDPMDEYLAVDPAQWKQRLQDVDADFVCVGHSHLPFCLDIDGIKVVNPGSVGQPRDGNPHASYAIIENGEVTHYRVEYDVEAALDQIRSTGLPDWVTELNAAILKTGGRLTRDEMDAFV